MTDCIYPIIIILIHLYFWGTFQVQHKVWLLCIHRERYIPLTACNDCVPSWLVQRRKRFISISNLVLISGFAKIQNLLYFTNCACLLQCWQHYIVHHVEVGSSCRVKVMVIISNLCENLATSALQMYMALYLKMDKFSTDANFALPTFSYVGKYSLKVTCGTCMHFTY